jgi:cation diffusion facilitator CzcD-associated flavoprotein CzcO
MTCQTRRANFAGVMIIGGGPAGLAAAIALRQKGIDCMVVETVELPIDKCWGEGFAARRPGPLLHLPTNTCSVGDNSAGGPSAVSRTKIDAHD